MIKSPASLPECNEKYMPNIGNVTKCKGMYMPNLWNAKKSNKM